MAEENEQAARRMFAAFNTGDLSDADSFISDDYLNYEADRVAVYTVMTGKQVGDFMGITPTGKTISVKQMHLFHIADGKIATHRAVRDDLCLMLQLGALHFGAS